MKKGDITPTVLIPGDPGRVEMFASLMDEAEKVAGKREYITYTGKKDGVPISCTSAGLGTPPTAIGVEELIRISAKNFIRTGTCGAIQEFLELGHRIIATGAARGEHTSEEFIKVGAKNFIRIGTGGVLQEWLSIPSIIVGTTAIRGDGTSVREYFPLEFLAVADFFIVEAMVNLAKGLGVEVFPGIIRGHDAFYSESIFASIDYLEWGRPWIEAGALITSNESSMLFPLAMARGCRAGTILVSPDCHQRPEVVAPPDVFNETVSKAMRIALEAAVRIHQLDHI